MTLVVRGNMDLVKKLCKFSHRQLAWWWHQINSYQEPVGLPVKVPSIVGKKFGEFDIQKWSGSQVMKAIDHIVGHQQVLNYIHERSMKNRRVV